MYFFRNPFCINCQHFSFGRCWIFNFFLSSISFLLNSFGLRFAASRTCNTLQMAKVANVLPKQLLMNNHKRSTRIVFCFDFIHQSHHFSRWVKLVAYARVNFKQNKINRKQRIIERINSQVSSVFVLEFYFTLFGLITKKPNYRVSRTFITLTKSYSFRRN